MLRNPTLGPRILSLFVLTVIICPVLCLAQVNNACETTKSGTLACVTIDLLDASSKALFGGSTSSPYLEHTV